jgi:uncharacterized protein YjbJ (UPF0337 family)
MDKDRVVGVAKQIIGSLKQVFGRAVGDTKLQVNGTTEKGRRRAADAAGGAWLDTSHPVRLGRVLGCMLARLSSDRVRSATL